MQNTVSEKAKMSHDDILEYAKFRGLKNVSLTNHPLFGWELSGEGNAYNTRLLSGTHGNISLNASYHGDRDEFWVVVEKEGKETERINARMVTNHPARCDWRQSETNNSDGIS